MRDSRRVSRGLLIVFEGIDGSGKSTQLERCAVALRAQGVDLVTTREPTDGQWGRRIRELARSGGRAEVEEELRWFVEDRHEHLREVIEPAILRGQSVLCDRYILSTVAYQGARGLDWRELVERFEHEFPQPDIALFFDVDVDTALERIRSRAGVADPAFEEREYLKKVAEIYAKLTRVYRFRIDGNLDEDKVAFWVERALEGMF